MKTEQHFYPPFFQKVRFVMSVISKNKNNKALKIFSFIILPVKGSKIMPHIFVNKTDSNFFKNMKDIIHVGLLFFVYFNDLGKN